MKSVDKRPPREVTTGEIRAILTAHDDGEYCAHIAKRMGRKYDTVRQVLLHYGRTPNKLFENHQSYYTVYDNRTDEVVGFGSARQCAAAMGIQLGSFYHHRSLQRAGRPVNKWRIVKEGDPPADE